jgi:hypothetical protein
MTAVWAAPSSSPAKEARAWTNNRKALPKLYSNIRTNHQYVFIPHKRPVTFLSSAAEQTANI